MVFRTRRYVRSKRRRRVRRAKMRLNKRIRSVVDRMAEPKYKDLHQDEFNVLNYPRAYFYRLDQTEFLPQPANGANAGAGVHRPDLYSGREYYVKGMMFNVTLEYSALGLSQGSLRFHLVSFNDSTYRNTVGSSQQFNNTYYAKPLTESATNPGEPFMTDADWTAQTTPVPPGGPNSLPMHKAYYKVQATGEPQNAPATFDVLHMFYSEDNKQRWLTAQEGRVPLFSEGYELLHGVTKKKTWTVDIPRTTGVYHAGVKRFRLYLPIKKKIVTKLETSTNAEDDDLYIRRLFRNPTYLVCEGVEKGIQDNATCQYIIRFTARLLFSDPS